MDSNEIIELLTTLGEKLEGPAQQVFALAVKQQFVEGLTILIGLVILWIGGGLAAFIGARAFDKAERDSLSEMLGLGVGIVGGFALFIGAVLTLCLFVPMVGKLLNPEWAALKAIADLIPR